MKNGAPTTTAGAARACRVLFTLTAFAFGKGMQPRAFFVGAPRSAVYSWGQGSADYRRSDAKALPRFLHPEQRTCHSSRKRRLNSYLAPCYGIAGPAVWSSRRAKASCVAGVSLSSDPVTGIGGSKQRRQSSTNGACAGSSAAGRTIRMAQRGGGSLGATESGTPDGGVEDVTGGHAAAALEADGDRDDASASDEHGWVKKRWHHALAKIKKEPLQILTIPVSAACVGWITNKLAVEMIFHPLVWRGIPLRVVEGQPLGLIGWQGIVPAKAGVMAERMVDMVTTQLVDVEKVFSRLSPRRVARLLGPEINTITQNVCDDLLPGQMTWLPGGFAAGLRPQAVDELKGLRRQMLLGLTKDLQKNITKVLDLKEMVVGEMLRDRSLMVSLFQRCGKAEFKFLVNSGFSIGFLLGVVQMFAWLLYDKPWTLPAGGAIVGYITNWVALKLIFEPVDPVKIGPFVLQGLFLRRQNEVAADFAEFFSSNVLTSKKLWAAMLDGSRAQAFQDLVAQRVVPFVSRASAVAGANLDPITVKSLALRAAGKLRDHVHVLHHYTDQTLALRQTMTVEMQKMSTRTFEGVLHPVFQEEEFTLIVAGGVLGAIAGFLQMLLSTKGVREAAKKAAALAATKAASAADGVVGASEELVGEVAGPGAQAVVTGWRERAGCMARRCLTATDAARLKLQRSLTSAIVAVAAAVADRYHRRRRRSTEHNSDGSSVSLNEEGDPDDPSPAPPRP